MGPAYPFQFNEAQRQLDDALNVSTDAHLH
jgi:hypothetical protein